MPSLHRWCVLCKFTTIAKYPKRLCPGDEINGGLTWIDIKLDLLLMPVTNAWFCGNGRHQLFGSAWEKGKSKKPDILTLLCANFFRGNQTHIFIFYVIPPHWHDTSSWNPSLCKTRTYLFYIVNTIGADVLVTLGARASATMIFTMLNQINSVPTH